MMTNEKPNWYVRVLLILLGLFIASLISYNFFAVDPKGSISGSMLTLIGILVILVLSESFDNFSVGKLLSIQRRVAETEDKAQKLEAKNAELLKQLIQISTNQRQQQSTLHVSGDYHAHPTIEQATPEEVDEQRPPDEASTEPRQAPARRRLDWRKVEPVALEKYLANRGIHPSNVIQDVKLTTQFHGLDPISNYDPIFDGYLKGEDGETFLEFRPASFASPMFRDRLYVMLTKISYYRAVKKSKAVMDFVLIKTPHDEERRSMLGSRWLESFQPAIANGLLRIHEVVLSDDDLSGCYDE